MSCDVGHRLGSEPTLLWLQRRPTDVAQIRPPGWELTCAASAALTTTTTKKAKVEKKERN